MPAVHRLLALGNLLQTGRILGRSCYRAVEGLKANDDKPRTYTRKTIDPFAGAWSTPSTVEFTVVRAVTGERPDQLAQLVDGLWTLYEHIGDWTRKPAPLYFNETLKEYLADFNLDEKEKDGEEGAE